MKFLLALVTILSLTSCSNKIEFNKFNVNSEIKNGILQISIDSDLPSYSEFIVLVDRTYNVIGDAVFLPITYFIGEFTLEELQNKIIPINNENWGIHLTKYKKSISKGYIVGSFVNKISDSIRLQIILKPNQSNQSFGKNNENLEGNQIKINGSHFFSKIISIQYPIDFDNNYVQELSRKMQKFDYVWNDDIGEMKGKIFLTFENRRMKLTTKWSSGFISVQNVIMRIIGNEIRFYVSDSNNEYFIINRNNEMLWYDDFGLFESYQLIRND